MPPSVDNPSVAAPSSTSPPVGAPPVGAPPVGAPPVAAPFLASTATAEALPQVDPSRLRPTPRALELAGSLLAGENDGIPLAADDTRLVVAFGKPPSADVLARLAGAIHRSVVPVLADTAAVSEVRRTVFGGGARPVVPAHIDELLAPLLQLGGSDLHLSAGAPPKVRVHGTLEALATFAPLESDTIRRLVYGILTEVQIRGFEENFELDTAYAIPGASRFRMNVFRQRGNVGAVLRAIPFKIPDFDSLGLPPTVKKFADLPRGLVLVTGPTGSGKSTTLAALLDIVNRNKAVHIISCEDPIEFVHEHRMAIINQREVGQDTHSFAEALKRALREDPDVILVGEMRDLETIHMALTAAETGHLVFGTLHTQSAHQTVDRIIDVFPPAQQGQVRTMLAASLQAVVTQQLVVTADGKGRAAAAEVLVVTPAVRNLVREGKGHQLPTQMQAGGQYGMVTMDQSLAHLVRTGRISMETALERASNAEDLRNLLKARG